MPPVDLDALEIEVLKRLEVIHVTVGLTRITSSTAWAEVGALGQQPPLVGVGHQGLHGEAELVSGRVHAVEDEQHDRDAQFLVAETILVEAGPNQGRW